ncbi:hypothetical protein [Clavibacter michiganensis]|uniref:hypothetical protein n=1 Tax=Clavibacter michiganensis TaxID=28447 RepID=UPI003757DA30
MKNRFLAPLGLTVAAAFLLTSCAGTGQEAAPTAGGANGSRWSRTPARATPSGIA